MTAYYNEIDPYAAQWLRNLINAGHIAPGIVDERSIEDVHPSDLRGFTQCHFFAGIGVWSHSLRAAGWPDDRPVWTGSCPCQPFSAAGKGSGFDDQRHLWPAFHHLIQECKPAIILGEQVASKDADPWVNLVQADVEALGYGFGAVPFPAACVGAPHIRDRLYWVADTKQHHRGSQAAATHHGQQEADRPTDRTGGCGVLAGRMANDNEKRWGRRQGLSSGCDDDGKDAGRFEGDDGLERIGEAGVFGVEKTGCRQQQECRIANQVPDGKQSAERSANSTCRRGSDASEWAMEIAGMSTGPANGHWRDADWLLCRDGKWRPVEPGTFPLVDGAAGGMGRVRADWHTPAGKEGFGHRAGRLKGYGNAINAEAARIFIECVMEVRA